MLDGRLEGRAYLAEDYSIADIANWAWVHTHAWSGVSLEALPHLSAWVDRLANRPACQRGIQVPTGFDPQAILRMGSNMLAQEP